MRERCEADGRRQQIPCDTPATTCGRGRRRKKPEAGNRRIEEGSGKRSEVNKQQ